MPETTFQLLRQGRVREALETLPRDAAESLGSLILGTAASTAGPVGIAAFGGTLGLDQMGQMRNERRELGLDPQVTAIDAGSAAAGAALQAGRMRGGVLPRMGREGLQETGQQGTQIGGNALQGVDKSQGEIVDELGQAFVLGGAMRGGQDAVSTVARAPAAATGALVRGAADLTRRDTVRNYDDEQVASDLRVVEAYNRRRAAEQSSTTNSEVDASVTFKGIMDDYTRALKELGGALEAGGQINREQRRLFDAAISEGARHNREVADPAGPDYFETLRQRLSGIGLDPQVEETAIRAIRDLNTATYNSKYKNRRGPFESAASKIPGPLGIGPLAAITAAATANPTPLAALAARGLARRAGAALDRVAGTSGPEVLARARVVAREAARRGLPQGNIATDLQDTTFDIKARTATQQQQSQAQAAAYNQQANALGLVRGGGWAPAITSTVSNIAPGKAAPNMRNSFRLWNEMVQRKGVKGFSDFLFSEFTVSELNKAMEEAGIDLKVSGENMDTKVFGSAILGPKIGNGFFLNLNGQFDQLTMDMWWMRMWGRMTGDLVPKPSKDALEKQRNRFEEAVLNEGSQGMARYTNLPSDFKATKSYLRSLSDKEVSDLTERIESWASKNDWDRTGPLNPKSGNKASSEVSSAAKRWNENFSTLNETPGSGGKRNFMRATARRAIELLKENGVDITAADFQAVLWYPEQRLYQQVYGRGRGTDTDYAQAIKKILEKGGISEQELEDQRQRGFEYRRL